MKIYDVVVIGGGASGVMSAIFAAKNYNSVLIIEKGSKIFKKILVTGNGKCNLTNKNITSEFYNQNIDSFLNKFSHNDAIDFFKKIGLETYFDECGRCYPITNCAKSVMDCMQYEVNKLNIDVKVNTEFISFIKSNDYFEIKTSVETIFAKNIIFSVGGNAGKILQNCGIDYKEFNPSLVALETKSTKKLSGIRLNNVKITAKCKNSSYSEIGEVLFKDSGLSGVCIFNASSIFARNNCYIGNVTINLLPEFLAEELKKLLNEHISIFNKTEDLLTGILQREVASEILLNAKIKKEFTKDLNKKDIEVLVNTIQNWSFDIVGHYDNNQIYSGGVNMQNLTENLELKTQKNIYFCGEICDVDGICGGYNLQWAWTSGYICGNAINRKK